MLENKFTLEIFQGSTFAINLTVQNANGSLKDLSGYSAKMQIRPSYNSNTVIETLQTTTGEIGIDFPTSTITLTLPASRTANIAVDRNGTGQPPRSKYVYDLEIIDAGGFNTKLLYGDVIVYSEVTRL